MSDKIEKLTSDLSRIMNSNQYRVEIDTEDMVLGFRKTLTTRTKNMAKWLRLQIKTQQDIGRFISPRFGLWKYVGSRMASTSGP